LTWSSSRGPAINRARLGGSPFVPHIRADRPVHTLNVAVGLAPLGHRTALLARLADNAFGRVLHTHAAASVTV
jgi:fructokinase